MHSLFFASLMLNVMVLVPVCTALLLNVSWVADAFGVWMPARGILLAIYLAILIVSGVQLLWQQTEWIAALLTMQIVYKLLSPLTVGSLKNPVVISNLLITAFHLCTLSMVYK